VTCIWYARNTKKCTQVISFTLPASSKASDCCTKLAIKTAVECATQKFEVGTLAQPYTRISMTKNRNFVQFKVNFACSTCPLL